MSDKKRNLPAKWEAEKKAVRATQVAFDVGEQIQYVIRKEALDKNVNPSDRIRQILGLKVTRKPKRLRLSVSLSDEDLTFLAEQYQLEKYDTIEVKRRAAEQLVAHVRNIIEQE
ncbi:hypothetical protein ACFODZ_16620 [Marinicella sediminis]|uniref:Ribbon-helix-helix protein, CopG family n=1 Tax=Marinicella sediminis TaxID=1792834 RepID=A0ABV7JG56_9GAMM|nr:hypothetical protein [Marinicella sediminis]